MVKVYAEINLCHIIRLSTHRPSSSGSQPSKQERVPLSALRGPSIFVKRHWAISRRTVFSCLLKKAEGELCQFTCTSQFTVQQYGGRDVHYFLMITAPCASPLLWAPWPPHPVPDPAPNTTPPACHAPPGRVSAAAALLGLHSGPVRTVQVPGEHGWGLGVGAVRVPAEIRVHERLHADQGGSAGNHVWESTREILHSGEFMGLFFFYVCINFKMWPQCKHTCRKH